MASLERRKNSPYWYIRDRIAGRSVRESTKTDSLQLAKAKLREYESRKARGVANPFPTRTPIAEVVQAYVEHIRDHKTAKSAQTDARARRVYLSGPSHETTAPAAPAG